MRTMSRITGFLLASLLCCLSCIACYNRSGNCKLRSSTDVAYLIHIIGSGHDIEIQYKAWDAMKTVVSTQAGFDLVLKIWKQEVAWPGKKQPCLLGQPKNGNGFHQAQGPT